MSRVSKGLEASEDAVEAISDISVTGTYATDDTPIETAINSILAALRDAGVIQE